MGESNFYCSLECYRRAPAVLGLNHALVAVVRCGSGSGWSAGQVVGGGVRGSADQQRCERGYPTLSPSLLPPNVSTSTCQVQFSSVRGGGSIMMLMVALCALVASVSAESCAYRVSQ